MLWLVSKNDIKTEANPYAELCIHSWVTVQGGSTLCSASLDTGDQNKPQSWGVAFQPLWCWDQGWAYSHSHLCFFFLKVMSIFPMRWQQAFVSQMVLCFSLMQLRGWVSSSARGSFQTLTVESLILLYHEGLGWVLLSVLKGFWRTVWEGNVFQPNQGVKPPASVARLGMTHVTCRLIP